MIKENQNLLNKINALTDVLLLFLSMIVSYFIRFTLFYHEEFYITLHTYLKFTLFMIPVYLILYIFFNLYDPVRTTLFSKECSKIIKANLVLITIALSSLFVFKFVHISRLVIVIFYFVNTTLIIFKRGLLRRILSNLRKKGLNLKHILIVGAGKTASEYLSVIQNNKTYGYNYVGYVSNSSDFYGEKLGDYNQLLDILYNYKFDEVICALDIEDAEYIEKIVSDCEKSGTKISIIPFCYKYIPVSHILIR